MAEQEPLRPHLPILFGAAVMLSLSMGIRRSFGLFDAAGHRRHRADGFGFHAGAGSSGSRLGAAAARRRRACRTLPVSARSC